MCACACVCEVSPHTNKQSFGHSWISCVLIEFWHYLPGDSIRIHRSRAQSHKTLPPLIKMPVTSTGYHPYFWPMGYRLEVPKTPSLVLINLLEWLTETFYLLDHWFIIKGFNSGRARWKKCMEQSIGKGHRASSMPLSPNPHVFTNGKLSDPSPFVFVEWGSLQYIGVID